MKLSDFDYLLPEERIAQRPLENRDASRMLVMERALASGEAGLRFEDRLFSELPSLLRGDELVVVNNARVIPARLLGRRVGPKALPGGSEGGEGEIEILLSRQLDENKWEGLVRPGRKMHVGQRVQFGDGRLEAEVTGHANYGQRTLRFFASRDASKGTSEGQTGGSVQELMNEIGHMPLPPYIERADEEADRERYQTIFANRPGAIAAPTAGLHFTPKILDQIRTRGVEICELTLHVGLGTFQPMRGETLEEHRMHSEAYEISGELTEKITAAKKEGRRILAIGTTTVRALEAAALSAKENGADGVVRAGKADANLFITPGFSFRVVDALLTNFHLPRSTLLALVSALAGRERILEAYRHAVEAGYRFYSYGDCMLIR
ncbi:MAG TPA: tRNA preQ1(34) S-adenosylmethionine ribosyltransferase-isomerase QueA [Candidatus Acidoferrum sp.]